MAKHITIQLLTSLFLCLANQWISAQAIAQYQLNDKDAITINDEVLDLLASQRWVCTEQTFVMYNRGKTYRMPPAEINIKTDGSIHHNGLEGNWYVLEDKLLVLELDTLDFKHRDIFFAGGFNIHWADNCEIMLVKNLTSDYDNRIFYYLRKEEKRVARK